MACLFVNLNARNPMTRTFAYLAMVLMVLAGTSSARATMDDDFFNFRGRQQQPMMQQQQPMQQRGVPYYGPGSDYFGGGSSGPIQRERVSAPISMAPGSIFISTSERRLYLMLGNG
jgi:hypothetical protein